MKADPSETFIAVESISSTLARFAAKMACAALESAGRPVNLVEMPDLPGETPLRDRTAGMIGQVIRPILNRRAVVLTPGPGTLLALRRATGRFTIDDDRIADRWATDVGEPNLTILIDIDPVEMDMADTAALAFFDKARAELLSAAGHHRDTWVALSGAGRRGPLADEVGRAVIRLLHSQTVRWPLEHGWRHIRAAGV
jgi:hypothetical protein